MTILPELWSKEIKEKLNYCSTQDTNEVNSLCSVTLGIMYKIKQADYI